jgi:hypothetical protein
MDLPALDYSGFCEVIQFTSVVVPVSEQQTVERTAESKSIKGSNSAFVQLKIFYFLRLSAGLSASAGPSTSTTLFYFFLVSTLTGAGLSFRKAGTITLGLIANIIH